jgi:hypothetical protein
MSSLKIIFLRTLFDRSPENSFSSTLRSDEKMKYSNYVVIMDNAVIHKSKRIKELIEATGND